MILCDCATSASCKVKKIHYRLSTICLQTQTSCDNTIPIWFFIAVLYFLLLLQFKNGGCWENNYWQFWQHSVLENHLQKMQAPFNPKSHIFGDNKKVDLHSSLWYASSIFSILVSKWLLMVHHSTLFWRHVAPLTFYFQLLWPQTYNESKKPTELCFVHVTKVQMHQNKLRHVGVIYKYRGSPGNSHPMRIGLQFSFILFSFSLDPSAQRPAYNRQRLHHSPV